MIFLISKMRQHCFNITGEIYRYKKFYSKNATEKEEINYPPIHILDMFNK